MLVTEKYQHQRPVADGSHEENEREQNRHDVRFRSFRVIVIVDGQRVVGRVVQVPDTVIAIAVHLASPPTE